MKPTSRKVRLTGSSIGVDGEVIEVVQRVVHIDEKCDVNGEGDERDQRCEERENRSEEHQCQMGRAPGKESEEGDDGGYSAREYTNRKGMH